MKMYFTGNKLLAIVSTVGVFLALSLSYIGESPVDSPIDKIELQGEDVINLAAKSIATEWDWTQFKEVSDSEYETKLETISDSSIIQKTKQFDLEFIYQSLHAVRLDEEGDVILDHEALQALNKVLSFQNLKFTNQQLESLLSIIKKGLPGEAGEQTAEIVGNYYQFLGAEDEFNNVYETTSNPEAAMNRSFDDLTAQFQELQALRSLYLGESASEKLFAVSDASAEYMFESKRIEEDASLSDEEKSAQQKEAVKRHDEITVGVENWTDRYVAFLDEKQLLLNASLTAEDKKSQLRRILESHFTLDELEKVSHLALEVL